MSNDEKVPTHVTFPSAVFDKVGFTLSALLECPEVDEDFKTCIKDLFEADSRGPYFELHQEHADLIKRVASLESQLSQAREEGFRAGFDACEEANYCSSCSHQRHSKKLVDEAVQEYKAQRDAQKGEG